MSDTPISDFMLRHFRHFNAATVVDATRDYIAHLDSGGKMMVTLAGAMSTAELGVSLAEMIRAGKVHAISCTGANLEEDLFNLVAHDHYVRVPRYRDLSPEDEVELLNRGLNRVTDTCIPEDEAMRVIEVAVIAEWRAAEAAGQRLFPHELLYRTILNGRFEGQCDADPRDSWLVAAAQANLPMVVPGWEDSTLGNFFVANQMKKVVDSLHTVRSGLEYMQSLIEWYREVTKTCSVGFFQIGGGIAGDFPICVVPLICQDLEDENIALWGYFCQISDSTTSFGSYSGAVPNEKITWGKLGVDTPRHVIESDATIVAPLMFAAILEDRLRNT